MKVINSKLAAIGLAAFVFASCSDSTSDGPSTNPSQDVIEALGLTATTPTAAVNYKNSTANARKFFATRASNENFVTSMPEMPTAPALISELNAPIDLVYDANKVTNTYVLKNAKSVDFSGKQIKGVTIFIKGDATFTYDQTGGGNTFVLEKGAKLNFKGNGPMLAKGDKLYNKLSGSIKSENDIVIEGEIYADWVGTGNEKGQAMKGGLGTTTADEKGNKVVPTQNITFKSGAKAFINGSLRAKKLTIEDGAVVTSTCNVLNSDQIDLAGALKVDGFTETGTLNMTGLLDASAANAAVKASKELNMEAGSKIKANYINVTDNEFSDGKVTKFGNASLNLKNGSEILISNKSVINANNINTDNASAGQITLQGDDAVAVVKADKFTNNGAENITTFATPGNNAVLLFQFNKCFDGTSEIPSQADLDIAASYLDYDKATKGDVVKLKDENHKKYGYELTVDVNSIQKQPKLDLVATFGNNNGMSASCIQTVGNYVYVSYHTYGNGKTNLGGGLEVLRMDGNTLTAEQELSANRELDINHLIVDNSKVYIAASDYNKGAFLGVVPLEGNVMKTGEDAMTQYVLDAQNKKNGIDANCVVKYGNNIVMATTRGYELYDQNFTHTWFQTSDDAKHVTVGNNKLYGLLAKGTTTGTINVFTGVDLRQSAATSYTTFGNVTPVDAKNTIAYNGGDLYVCQGINGLVRYDANGDKVWSYTVPAIHNEKSEKYGNVKGNCNGVAVDDNYVYVAAGGYGLVVLNKKDGTEICHRLAYNGKTEKGQLVNANSANYVTIGQDGYLYVAYGKSRVQVFKLTNTLNK